MRFPFFSRVAYHWLLFLTLMGVIPVGTGIATTAPVSPTSSLPYTLLGNVTYRMEIIQNLSIYSPGIYNVEIYAPHMLNWSISVPDGDSNLQTSILIGSATSSPPDFANISQIDKYNNSFDYFRKSLSYGDSFTLSMNYTIITRQVRWDNLGTPSMTDYDTGTSFYKLYTQNQPSFINITDPAIISTAATICGTETNPVEIARKIYNWVSTSITYESQTDAGTDGTGEKGASWALTYRKGDCSEYSDLMVALLRAQGVPARKVVGLALLDPLGGQLSSYAEGATWTYNQANILDNSTGHAWVEYFVPGAGWVACDPTWGHNGQNYFNYIDHLHVSSCRGEYFGDEVVPTLISKIGYETGEYPFLPTVLAPTGAPLNSSRIIRFTVIESNIWVDYSLIFIVIAIAIIIGVIGIIYWALRKRTQKIPLDDSHY